ncbi:hypothetical protein ACNAN0_08335 [Agrilactobacillus fermenti]|uniref:hypothetical protein n=1 Tax=Agrilactobacillus fermenti TaxID=2586909 RepID=UPI001E3113E6|nr:hypothetical protein [Agrilactobacillus fermenti]MCD2257254.1 hypothetical protein [Agrilactobacillus fermenti]
MIQDRFYQPKDAKDAIRFVSELFNQYKDAPLTDALVAYNQKLINYLENDVAQAAVQEHNQVRRQRALEMATTLRHWVPTRLEGQYMRGKMHNGRLTKQNNTKYKTLKGQHKNRPAKYGKTMHK